MMLYSIVFGSICLCFIVQLKRRLRPRQTLFPKGVVARASEPFIYRDLAKCKKIICGGCLGDPNWGPPLTLLESRAGPNQRLIHTFGIDNAFTTKDEIYRKQFRASVRTLLRTDDGGWKCLADLVQTYVSHGVRQADDTDGSILLVPLVQSVVFKFAVFKLFSSTIDQSQDPLVAGITGKINTLWMDSKMVDRSGQSLKTQSLLRDELRDLFPDAEQTPRGNPLNLILPAYETLWRVVLRCFMEVTFRSGDGDRREWRQLFSTFLSHPTKATFEMTTSGVSVSMVVTEALRLYPPTRRIYRLLRREFGVRPEVVAADIEYLHRDSSIWGDDSLCFKPSRWIECPRDSFMPFGWKPLVCPAKDEIGPMMIGILVAAMVVRIPGELSWQAIRKEDEIDWHNPLRQDRDSYMTLKLCNVAT
ncbi:MAG: hypothetical protein M1840_004469 [Geoglossum simile]|nr:MAG: hypothetical protein M1840_004469 [Geoglossum simile]